MLVLSGIPRPLLSMNFNRLFFMVKRYVVTHDVSVARVNSHGGYPVLVEGDRVVIFTTMCDVYEAGECVKSIESIDARIDLTSVFSALAELESSVETVRKANVIVKDEAGLLTMRVVATEGEKGTQVNIWGSYADFMRDPGGRYNVEMGDTKLSVNRNYVNLAGAVVVEGVAVPIMFEAVWPTMGSSAISIDIKAPGEPRAYIVPRDILASDRFSGLRLQLDFGAGYEVARNAIIERLDAILANISRLIRVASDALLYKSI